MQTCEFEDYIEINKQRNKFHLTYDKYDQQRHSKLENSKSCQKVSGYDEFGMQIFCYYCLYLVSSNISLWFSFLCRKLWNCATMLWSPNELYRILLCRRRTKKCPIQPICGMWKWYQWMYKRVEQQKRQPNRSKRNRVYLDFIVVVHRHFQHF